MIIVFTGKKNTFQFSIEGKLIFQLQMFLSARKENILPTASTHRKATEELPKALYQLPLGSPPHLQSDSNLNFQIFQNQLKRISAICQNQRRQKYEAEQAKNRIENLLKVSEFQKTQSAGENEKLRIQLTEMIKNMRQIQNKSNLQAEELYGLRTKNSELWSQIHNLTDYKLKYEEKCRQEQKSENKVRTLMQELVQCKNQLIRFQIDNSCLKESMHELSLYNKKLLEKKEEKVFADSEKLNQLEKQLNHWKNVFQSKEKQFQSKVKLLEQEKKMMKQAFEQFQTQNEKRAKCFLQKSCNLGSSLNAQTEAINSLYLKLLAKQSQIEKLKQKIKDQQDKIVLLDLQNRMLQSSSGRGSLLTTLTYNKYTDLTSTFLRNNELQVEVMDFQTQLQAKEGQAELIREKLSAMERQMENMTISSKQLLSEVQKERIAYENTSNELVSLKNRFQIETYNLKEKICRLEKECSQKDRIILTFLEKKNEV